MKNVLILYSTMTYNTEDAAKGLYERLSKINKSFNFEIVNVREIQPEFILKFENIILALPPGMMQIIQIQKNL